MWRGRARQVLDSEHAEHVVDDVVQARSSRVRRPGLGFEAREHELINQVFHRHPYWRPSTRDRERSSCCGTPRPPCACMKIRRRPVLVSPCARTPCGRRFSLLSEAMAALGSRRRRGGRVGLGCLGLLAGCDGWRACCHRVGATALGRPSTTRSRCSRPFNRGFLRSSRSC